MKLKLHISVISMLLLYSCAERENYNDINGPVITGLFTELKGSISGQLTITDSPFKVTEDIIVDSNTTLTINTGVEIYFTENTRLIVYGELIIEGNYYRSVYLESFDRTKFWRGIKINNTDKPTMIDYARIRGIKETGDTLNLSASISIVNSDVTIIHSIINENSAIHGGAFGIYNSKVIIKNNLIRDNFAEVYGGAIVSELSNIQIINNTFYHDSSYNSVGGILVFNPIKTELQNNIFYKNRSRSGQNNFYYASDDSTTLLEQYNYLAFGNMDPIFYSETYLTLYGTSPCVNGGNPDSSFNDYNGTRNDQGAYGGPDGNW
jgi:hypothetical protein